MWNNQTATKPTAMIPTIASNALRTKWLSFMGFSSGNADRFHPDTFASIHIHPRCPHVDLCALAPPIPGGRCSLRDTVGCGFGSDRSGGRVAGRWGVRAAIAIGLILLMIAALVEGASVGTAGGSATWRRSAGRDGWRPYPVRASYRWPLAGHPTVVTPFRPPPRPWLPGHRGVDLAAIGRDRGDGGRSGHGPVRGHDRGRRRRQRRSCRWAADDLRAGRAVRPGRPAGGGR